MLLIICNVYSEIMTVAEFSVLFVRTRSLLTFNFGIEVVPEWRLMIRMFLLICNVYSEIMTVTEFSVVFGANVLLVNGLCLE